MAELFVPKIIDQLSDVFLKQLEEGVNLVMGVEEEVGNLSNKWKTIEKVLHDAERRRLNEEGVRVWLEQLEDITYEMEDVLDEWNIKIVKPKNLDQQGARPKARKIPTLLNKVTSFIPSLCSCLKQVPVRSDIAVKVKEINGKLESTLREANQFNFVSTPSDHVDSKKFRHPMTTSIIDVSEVHGRDADKDYLLELLLPKSRTNTSKEVEKNEVKVISIVGVGGSGKTTLAQFLYDDDRVKEYFELRKWVCVSDLFDEYRIAKALIENPEKINVNSLSELEPLFRLIKDSFFGKRFLLVLDDVWTEEYSKWKPFRDSLKDGAPGSIILVTTRSESVVRVVGTDQKHSIGLLSNSDCWLIIKQIALSKRFELCKRVDRIGQKIAEKCKGLPLASKIMGSLLQFKDTPQEWQEVLDSEIWQMEKAALELFPHFYLSYNELPPQLKRCFSYCAVFPKDTNMEVSTLTRLWMAQGYLGRPSRRGDDRMEKRGYEYFKTLAMRSFFQELEESTFDENFIASFKMHDIVHDFAQFVIKDECRTFDEVDCQRVETKGGYLSTERLRHITMLDTTKSINSSIILNIEKVRSLFLSCYGELPQDLCSSLKSIRSLILSRCGLKELPREIGKLIHMRFLDVSENEFTELPETICDLHYLESLDVHECNELKNLPQRIGDLVHLRHLHNHDTKQLKQIPRGIEKLTSLCCLIKFIADGGPSNNIVELQYLNQLETLGIVARGPVDFENAQLGNKIYLEELLVEFESEGFDLEKGSAIEKIEPPPNLRVLLFKNYPTTQLPQWIVDKSLIDNLSVLCIYSADLVSSLPILGKMSSLQFLELQDLQNIKHLGSEFYGLPDLEAHGHHEDEDEVEVVAFPNLKILHISRLENWETWEDISEDDDEKMKNCTISVMPRLEEVRILSCSKLEALPFRVLRKASSLKILRAHSCDKLKERYSNKNAEDWIRISHIPNITIY